MKDSLYDHVPFYRMLHHEYRDDLPFYLDATRDCPRVLEYGVGYGRVALPMATRGQRVVGVDSSESMLAALHLTLQTQSDVVREHLSTVLADACTLSLDERFEAITCPFNGIAHHCEPDAMDAFFDRVHEHLAPQGRFIFDVFIPDPRALAGATIDVPWFRDPTSGAVCRSTERLEYDPLGQVLTSTTTVRPMEGDAEPAELVLHLRQLFPAETLLLLRHHGFEVLHREAGPDDSLAYICRARPPYT